MNDLVKTYCDWLDQQGISYDDNGYTEEQEKECLLVSKILATEQAIYLMRRTCGIDGSIIDAMRGLYCECVHNYVEQMGKPYVDLNEEVDF